MLLVVLPVCAKDMVQAVRNLEWCISLDTKVDYPCLISHEVGENVHAVVELASRYFSKIDIHVYDKWTGPKEWPIPQNKAFQATARFIESHYRMPWFWWEQDAIPLKANWISTLDHAHTTGGQVVSGAVTQTSGLTYVAGIAIYPWNVSSFIINALLCHGEAWDKIASRRDGMLRKSHDISDLIIHTPDQINVHFESKDDIFQRIPESAILFHKCKDGSLLDVLQGRVDSADILGNVPHGTSGNSLLVKKIPSFTEQTDWASGYFTFPVATDTSYFNCSVAERDGGLYLFTRRERWNLERAQAGGQEGRKNDLAIWKIRPNMTLHPQPIIPATPARYPREQWEDPRVTIGHDGHAYVAFATWVHHKDWKIRQSFTKLSPDWRKFSVLWETPYGGNARKPELAKGHEKNWIWFQHDGDWHCIYNINPMQVFKVSSDGSPVQKWENKQCRVPWEHGLPFRGGTPPVRVGDEYIAFFHTATVWEKPRRRYYMGAYTFDAEPPFELRRVTLEPLLTGSDQDFRALGGPLVIFPNGCVLQDDHWLVTFGVNDEACGWIKIPTNALEARLTEVNKKSFLSTLMEFASA